MLTSRLWIKGADFNARAAARRLGLPRQAYRMAGEPIELGPNQGTPRPVSILQIPLSDREDLTKHMTEMENSLDSVMTFLARIRARTKGPLDIEVSFGTTVGDWKYYTRVIVLPPRIMAKLAALDVGVQFNAYPLNCNPTGRKPKGLQATSMDPI